MDYEGCYIGIFGGSLLSAADFSKYQNKAVSYINYITFGQIDVITDDVIKAVCAVCEVLYKHDTIKEISSETVGKASVSYFKKDNSISIEKEKYNTAKEYLFDTGLMNRGVF